MTRRVVITGTGAVTPLGVGARSLHERWVAGVCGIEEGLGRCSEFRPEDHLGRKELRRTDRCTQLALAASDEALADAGWHGEPPYERDRIACVIGTGIGGIGSLEREHDLLRDRGERAVTALGVPMMMSNAPAGVVSMRHRLTGPNYGVVSACAAGAHALGTALRLVQAGDADAAVAGGAESTLTPLSIASFAAMGATSRAGVSRPFDARRDGFVLGEGAGLLVLEEAEAARRRGARVLGELRGFGASSDAFHLTAPEPGGGGAARAIRRALADAAVEPDELDYVNAHGTSTPLNDRSETDALKTALGDAAHHVPISSTKSAVGHLLGAGGAVEAVATLHALRDGVAPPTLGYGEPEEGLDLDYVPNAARPLNGHREGAATRLAISNSFGFGGHNAVLVIEAPR